MKKNIKKLLLRKTIISKIDIHELKIIRGGIEDNTSGCDTIDKPTSNTK